MLIVDQHTFEVVHCHTFMQQEYACSIMSCKLGEDNTPYYVVGTGFIQPSYIHSEGLRNVSEADKT